VTCAARCGDADPDTLVLADGFSCATQVRDATGRRTLRLAEVIAALGGVLRRRRARRDELVAEAGTSPQRRTR